MLEWAWSDPRWRENVGDEMPLITREAIRRAVELRDALADAQSPEATRAVFLVAVLNHLAAQLGVDANELWDRA